MLSNIEDESNAQQQIMKKTPQCTYKNKTTPWEDETTIAMHNKRTSHNKPNQSKDPRPW
jgi:hypothetical protein